ncbi:uncharacterized protein LOC119648260 [Hermetia illucens]|nr:uncharacterized protein LOC119648260 [Hermetia illucens]
MAELSVDNENERIRITTSTPPGSPRDRMDSSLSPLRKISDPWNISLNHIDELPIFSIRSIAPSSRSPSPIENISITSIPEVDEPNPEEEEADDSNRSHDQRLHDHDTDLVSLEEINAQIHTPTSYRPKRAMSLDTIFEGVFLETPPRRLDCNSAPRRRQFHSPPRRRMRSSLSCLVLEE